MFTHGFNALVVAQPSITIPHRLKNLDCFVELIVMVVADAQLRAHDPFRNFIAQLLKN
jgi:hypothetical protein